jgi:Tfp pilus assembly protein PilO
MASHEDYAKDEAAFAAEQAHTQDLESSLRALQTQLRTTRRAAADSTVHLRPPTAAPLHVAHISKLATEAGLQIDDMRTEAPTPGPYAIEVPVHLAGTGSYRACTQFLRQLRQALPETCVLSFTLAGKPNDTTGAAAVTMDLMWHATLPASHQADHGDGAAASTTNPPTETPST